MVNNYTIVQKDGKFVVAKNGEPILLPKSDGSNLVTEFDNKQDAERYISILKSLKSRSGYHKV